MKQKSRDYRLAEIAIDSIEVLNSRERNQEIFQTIVENIRKVGLKKPITVTSRINQHGLKQFILVCGEGRLLAFKQLGQTHIPAMIVEATDEDAFVMSLTENIARRRGSPLETIRTITRLIDMGYKPKEIAKKIDMTQDYIEGIAELMAHGEERLVAAVESGKITLTTALRIYEAAGDDKAVQAAMHEAFESGELKGKQFVQVRRLLDRRAKVGKDMSKSLPRRNAGMSSDVLIRTYKNEVERQRQMVRRSELTREKLLFLIQTMKTLCSDEDFVTLLRAEGLDSLPKYLADRVLRRDVTL